ncbi:MAG: DUF4832 domain-containing protein [Candidatus Cryptobacteroides sp.]
MKRAAIILTACLCVLACNKDSNSGGGTVGTPKDVIVDGNTVIVNPYEYYNAIRNPMKGWREFFGPGVDKKRAEYPYPFGSIIKEYMQWNMMEEVESDGVDKVIAYSNHRWEGVEDENIKVIPRPYIVWMEKYEGGYEKNTYTDNPDDLNGWHWPKDFPREVRSDDNNTPSTGGYFDPTFADRMKKLIKKLGEAWDNDPRVAYVEMGLIGEWGEHHDPNITTYWLPHTQDFHVANRTYIPGIEKVLGDAFRDAFKNKKVMVRYAYEFQDYEYGIYWDSFAIREEDERGFNAMKRLGDRWKTQVMGGEITWGWGSLWNAGHRSLEDCCNSESTKSLIVDQIRDLHINHLGGVTWANFNNTQFYGNASYLQKIMGYRFLIKDFKYPVKIEAGKPFDLEFSVVNTGSSPFYYDWPVEISLINPETKEVVWSKVLSTPKVSEWMPGDKWQGGRYTEEAKLNTIKETLTVDTDIEAGKYAIAVSVLDPAGMLPSLRFAIFNYYNGGRHPMGYVGVNQDIDEYKIPLSSFDDLQKDHSLHYVVEK